MFQWTWPRPSATSTSVGIPRSVGFSRCTGHARHAQREHPTQRGMLIPISFDGLRSQWRVMARYSRQIRVPDAVREVSGWTARPSLRTSLCTAEPRLAE